MKIDEKLFDTLADIAMLEFEPEEREARRLDLEGISDYAGKLAELDTEGLSEMWRPFTERSPDDFDIANRFREDDVTCEARAEELLVGAPDSKGTYLRVPRTVEE